MANLRKEVKKFVREYLTSDGKRWRVIVPDGRSGQIRKQGFISESSAVDFAHSKYSKVLTEDKKLSSTFYSVKTFGEYSDEWLDFKKRDGLAPATLLRYSDQIKNFLNPYFRNIKLKELEKFHLRNYISESQNSGVTSYNVRSTVIIFKMIIRKAIEEDQMAMNDILIVSVPKHRPKDPRFWDVQEFKYFLNATKESPRYQLWKFVLWSGLRGGELAALKWDCVHLEMKSGSHCGFIKVRRTYCQKTKQVREVTKTYDNRMIPIFPELRELILKLKEKECGEFVFGGLAPLDSSHFSRLLGQDLDKVPELKKINFHGLRHTFCSYLDSTGMPRRVVSEIMGHRDLSTTDRYSHISNQTLGSEVSRWIENQSQQKTNNFLEVAR